ncbi:MAG: rod shape-determining protein MreC [Alphaproteobacteria bacterium]|nr:rod shape-determining protein MreC [Alphaproteobacteria bacterium]
MNPKKVSSRLHTIIKSAFVAALLPMILLYIVIAKPDYRIMNGAAHIILPVVSAIGDLVTWPVRAGGNLVRNIRNISNLEQENAELRVRLYAALATKNDCDIALVENQRLAHELDIKKSIGYDTVVADVILDNSALNHGTFLIDRGAYDEIKPGMVVLSFDNTMVGIVMDTGLHYSRVRALTDSNTNIAVRVAGSDVYGFLHGNGSTTSKIGFFSDHKFQGGKGTKLVTSSISGILPPDIFVGTMHNTSDVDVLSPSKLSSVIVYKFNVNQEKYK